MTRRDLIALLGSTAATWPVGVRAQQGTMPVIGVLSARAAETDTALLGFFREGLRQSGYLEGHNVAVEYRWASGEYDRLAALATELIERHVQVGHPPHENRLGQSSP